MKKDIDNSINIKKEYLTTISFTVNIKEINIRGTSGFSIESVCHLYKNT